MIGARRLRLIATLIPGSLLLHESVFAISGGGMRASHNYLELLLPIATAVAASAAFAALLVPLLRRGASDGEAGPGAPLALAAALIGIFVLQESVEALLLGGGSAAFAADLAAAWLLLPTALLLGATAATLIHSLERGSTLILRLAAGSRPRRRRAPGRKVPVGSESHRTTISPLAFGLARRPPPRLALLNR